MTTLDLLQLPSFHLWTSRTAEEMAILRTVCSLCWEINPRRRAGMSHIMECLRIGKQRETTPRGLAEYNSEGLDINMHESDNVYGSLLHLNSKLKALLKQIDCSSEVRLLHCYLAIFLVDKYKEYFYLNLAWKVSSNLCSVCYIS